MISLQNISKRFDGTVVFENVKLEVAAGESVVLIGPSGSGKSVLLKIIAGLLAPDSGEVRLDTRDVGMLFQRNALFDSLTVEENLLFPLRERRGIVGPEAHRRTHALLEAVGLLGSERQLPEELSGGMQKRLGIARALVVEPSILLYDEPTAGLDPVTSRSIADLIHKTRKGAGTTLLCVTNDIQRAYQLGDRICLLARGRLVDGGSPAQVRSSTEPMLRQFIEGLPAGPLTSGGS